MTYTQAEQIISLLESIKLLLEKPPAYIPQTVPAQPPHIYPMQTACPICGVYGLHICRGPWAMPIQKHSTGAPQMSWEQAQALWADCEKEEGR